jgi:hypothetical protein
VWHGISGVVRVIDATGEATHLEMELMAGRGRTPTLPEPTDTMHSMGRSGHSARASSMARYVGLLYTTAPSCHLRAGEGS